MPSKNIWSTGLDWNEVLELVWAFEKQNQVSIEITLSVVVERGVPDLLLEARATDVKAESTEVLPLAYASVRCLAARLKSLAGVLTFLLYQLDFQLAEHEWEKPGAAFEPHPAKE